MIIKSIKLKNIRSYRDTTEIEIPEGKTLFLGDIGSGKSTILQAIEFALFGTGTSSESIKASSLLRRGEKTGYVELKAIIDNKEVIIRRNLKRLKNSIKQDNGYIIINGVKSVLSPSELKYKVLELLNYPEDLVKKSKSPIFRFTVYTPQEQMKQIFNMSDDERKETFRKIFQIEKYKRIRDNSTVLRQLLKEKKDYIEGYCSDLESKENELKEKRNKIAEIENKAKNIDQELTKLKEKEQSLKDKQALLKEKRDNLLKLEKESSGIQSKIEHLAKEITNTKEENERLNKEIATLKEEIQSYKIPGESKEALSNKLKELNNEINQYTIQKNSIINQLENIESQLNRLKRDEEQLNSLIKRKEELEKSTGEKPESLKQQIQTKKELKEKLVEERNNLEKTRYSNENKINEARALISKILDLKVCPLCLQEVNDEHKIKIKQENTKKAEELEKENQALLTKINEINEKIKNLDSEIDLLNKKYENMLVTVESLNSLNQQISRINQELINKTELIAKKQELNEKLNKLSEINIDEKKKIMQELEQKIELINTVEKKEMIIKEKLKRIENNSNKIAKLKESIKELNRTQIELSDKKKALEQEIEELKPVEDEVIKLKEKISEYNSEKKLLLERLDELKRETEKLNKEIDEKKDLMKKLTEIKKILSWLSDTFNPMVENIEKHLFARVYHRFNELFKKWLGKLIDEESLKVDLDLSFSPRITQNGYDASIFDLSGGEKTSIALAYRLALNQVINDLMSEIKTKDVIILDEPTDGFSSEQMDKVRDVLNELNIKQIILVSHENKIESFVDNKFRIYKENSVSRVLAE